jgi:hypothetical protein
MKKTLEPTGDMLIRFTEDELIELNIKEGDKFDLKPQADGSVKLEKYVNLELDMADWSIDVLQMIIKKSCEQDITVNEVLIQLLEQTINEIHAE